MSLRPASEALFRDAQRYIPGGVNSPVRAFRAVGGTPVFIERAAGPYLFDVDGNRYIDYVLSWGPMIDGKPTCRLGLSEMSGPKLREWRALVATAAKRAMGQRPPFAGPVKATLVFYFPRPASHTKAERLVPWVAVKGRHDVDKLQRAVFDALTDSACYEDDALVVHVEARKLYCDGDERPGVVVTLEAL